MDSIKTELSKKTMQVRQSSVGWHIKTCAKQMDNKITELLKPFGLNLIDFSILMTMMENAGLSQTAIGKIIHVPNYAMTRHIDKLEKMELLKRHANPNSRRAFDIRITNSGKKLGKKLFETVSEVNSSVLSPLTAKQQDQLLNLLKKVIDNH